MDECLGLQDGAHLVHLECTARALSKMNETCSQSQKIFVNNKNNKTYLIRHPRICMRNG
jgi:hypothetical protein